MCQMCHESCEPWTIRFMRLPLSMRRTSFFRPNWKGRTDDLIGKDFRVKQLINELNWYDRVPPPDWYRQKTISKEPQGGPLLGSFWIAEGLSPAEVHTRVSCHINFMKYKAIRRATCQDEAMTKDKGLWSWDFFRQCHQEGCYSQIVS